MNEDGTPIQSVFDNPNVLLGVAAGIAVVFLGILLFDLVRHKRHSRSAGEGFWSQLRKPFRLARDLGRELRRIAYHRSQRKELEERGSRHTRK